MKKIFPLFLSCSALAWLFCLASCEFDELPPLADAALCDSLSVTYNNTIKKIVDESCAYSGCHVSGGTGFGIYTEYHGDLLDALDSGTFQKWVIDQKDDPVLGMPPNHSAYPESLKDDLTDEELQIIRCWLRDGYPE